MKQNVLHTSTGSLSLLPSWVGLPLYLVHCVEFWANFVIVFGPSCAANHVGMQIVNPFEQKNQSNWNSRIISENKNGAHLSPLSIIWPKLAFQLTSSVIFFSDKKYRIFVYSSHRIRLKNTINILLLQ